jgi:hypothetical protein
MLARPCTAAAAAACSSSHTCGLMAMAAVLVQLVAENCCTFGAQCFQMRAQHYGSCCWWP